MSLLAAAIRSVERLPLPDAVTKAGIDFLLRRATRRMASSSDDFSLSAASFEKEEFPPALAKRLPHYPVPAAILGRLAVDSACQGQGLGEILLLDAVRRVVRASATLMVYAVIVDAKNDRAVAFYERYGFRTFASIQRRLFLPLETFEKLGL